LLALAQVLLDLLAAVLDLCFVTYGGVHLDLLVLFPADIEKTPLLR